MPSNGSRMIPSLPPPPPLLRIPNYTQTSKNAASISTLPTLTSGNPIQLASRQPSQAIGQYSDYANETPNLRTHLINLLKAPPSVPIQSSEAENESQDSYLPLTLPHDHPEDNPAEVSNASKLHQSYLALPSDDQFEGHYSKSVSDDSEYSFGDSSELSNADKCKLYRERNKEKRRADIQNYEKALQRNIELKAKHKEKEETIRKLKEYYYKCLAEQKINKKKGKKKKKKRSDKEDNKVKRGKEDDKDKKKEGTDKEDEKGEEGKEENEEGRDKHNNVTDVSNHMVILKDEIDLKTEVIDDVFSEKLE